MMYGENQCLNKKGLIAVDGAVGLGHARNLRRDAAEEDSGWEQETWVIDVGEYLQAFSQ
jgi:hypothetical protein